MPSARARRRKRRPITSEMAATSFCPSKPLIANFRYSEGRGRPSSKTTMEATTSSAPRFETSKHSIRSGAVGRSSASVSSVSAWLRVVRSPERRSLWAASDWEALRVTVSIRARLSPRRGTDTPTGPPRCRPSQSVRTSTSPGSGRAGTRTRRGTSASGSAYIWDSRVATSCASSASSTRSTMKPRSPRIRPSRTWKTRTHASSSSLARPTTSASVPSGRTTALRSSTRWRAYRSSRSRAARS